MFSVVSVGHSVNSGRGSHHMTISNDGIVDLTTRGPTSGHGISLYRDQPPPPTTPGHGPHSTGTLLPLHMFKLVHYEAWMVDNWAVLILREWFHVWIWNSRAWDCPWELRRLCNSCSETIRNNNLVQCSFHGKWFGIFHTVSWMIWSAMPWTRTLPIFFFFCGFPLF